VIVEGLRKLVEVEKRMSKVEEDLQYNRGDLRLSPYA
jgi:hypothetical protein